MRTVRATSAVRRAAPPKRLHRARARGASDLGARELCTVSTRRGADPAVAASCEAQRRVLPETENLTRGLCTVSTRRGVDPAVAVLPARLRDVLPETENLTRGAEVTREFGSDCVPCPARRARRPKYHCLK